MTMRSKIATSALVAAVLSVGLASADAAHKPTTLAGRQAHPPKHALVVGHSLKVAGPGSLRVTGPICRVGSHCPPPRHPNGPGGVGSDDGSSYPGDADHSGDGRGAGGGGPDGRNCLDDGCRQWQN